MFGGTPNALDFLPLDRSGNRHFLPVMVQPEQAEVHILENEPASRAYLNQVWAEAMTVYRGGGFKLSFSPKMVQYLKEHQREFIPEDTKAGMIQAYLDRLTGGVVCSKQLYKEALNHAFDEPKQWEIREVNDIMNHCITGWTYFTNPRIFEGTADRRAGSGTSRQRRAKNHNSNPRAALSRSRNRWSFPSKNPPRCRTSLPSISLPGCFHVWRITAYERSPNLGKK